MSDAFRFWCKHFTSRSPVCQDDMHVTSDEKNCSQNTPETGTKKRTSLTFLRRILFIQYIFTKPMQSIYDFSVKKVNTSLQRLLKIVEQRCTSPYNKGLWGPFTNFLPLLLSVFYVSSQLVYYDDKENCLWHIRHWHQ